jgi:DNA helicase II / ATP-dependent DNA helicase PcrA
VDRVLQEIYEAYEQALRDLNGLDFDDLLVFGVKLLKDHHIAEVEHLFVDEL